MAMRLDKFLSAAGAGTRSEVKKMIKSGLVTVNDIPAKRPEQPVDETSDRVCLRGKPLCYEAFLYFVFYKQKGCVTAVRDATHKTVMDDFPADLRKRLAPVGRLDLDTEGLLLLTDDGAFAHHIISPAHHVEKTYEAVLDAPVPQSAIDDFAKGIDIGDEDLTLPASLAILPTEVLEDGTSVYRARLTIREGRYHQVKRMFAAVGCKVVELKRLSIGSLTLEGLAPGEYRKLTAEEIEKLHEQ
jgi:16S rRNA pseudouridine516 synthase